MRGCWVLCVCEVFGFLEVLCFFLLVVFCVICVAWSSYVICVAVMFVWFSLLGVSCVICVAGSLVCGFRCSEFCCGISLLRFCV